MIKALALAAIRFYQRHLSAHKGFCCAYRFHTGRASCSMLGYRAIRRHGLWVGLVLLRARLGKCGVAHRRYHRQHSAALHGQAGFCDLSCDLPCDFDVSTACDVLGDLPCDCGPDWGSTTRKKQQEDAEHLPPERPRRTI
jgi:uncharacterized protein